MKHVFTCVVFLLSSLLLTAARGDEKVEIVTPKATDLIDKTEDYKGKTIQMVLTYTGAVDLRGAVGKLVPFALGNTDIYIDVLPGKEGSKIKEIKDLPNLTAGDRATVTFLCQQGDLNRGNRIIDIKRK